jgi:phospholipid/cholesterol/gamma-HCH transport system substrate-binding protein
MAHIRWSQLRIGLFVTVISIASAIVVFFIDRFSDMLSEPYTLYFHTLTNQPLARRAPVWLAGQPVGHVQSLRLFTPEIGQQDVLSVEMAIDQSAMPFITEGAGVRVTSAGLLGEAIVNITPATEPGPPAPEGSVLPAAYFIDPQEATHKFRAISDSLKPVIDRWGEVLQLARHGDGTLSRLMRQPSDLLDLHANLQAAAVTLDTVGRVAGGLAGLFSEPDVRGALDQLGPRLETLMNRWNDPTGSVGQFSSDTTLATHLESIQRTVAQVNERLETGDGTLGRFKSDRALAEELERTRELLQALRRDLSGGG